MDTKIIENALRDFRRKQSVVETTLARIESYKEARNNPDSFTHIFPGPSREPGMPRGTGISSSVENAITNKEKAVAILDQWIKDDYSRIYPYQIELEQLGGALNALTKQQQFIIECKYFEGMFWRDIEIRFNKEIRQLNYITVSGIRKLNTEALAMLENILETYYCRLENGK